MKFLIRKRRTPPAVIIVALIDVLIVLVIFLLVTTTFKQVPSLQLTLPASRAGAQARRQRQPAPDRDHRLEWRGVPRRQ